MVALYPVQHLPEEVFDTWGKALDAPCKLLEAAEQPELLEHHFEVEGILRCLLRKQRLKLGVRELLAVFP